MTTQFCRYEDSLLGAYAEAGQAAGHGWTDDYNGAQQEGFGRLQMTIRNGRRCSAATAYLRPALRRPNLRSRSGVLASRIVFEGTRAVGIEYVKDGQATMARAEREVLLCGGVINSPQLLMLSGIGDRRRTARPAASRSKADLPGVGKNLQDHVSTILMYRRKEPSPFLHMMRADRIGRELPKAYLPGQGLRGRCSGRGHGLPASRATMLPVPDIQILLTAAPLGAWPYLKPFKAPFNDGFAARLVMLHPESRGTVSLQSSRSRRAPAHRAEHAGRPKRTASTMRAGVKHGPRHRGAAQHEPLRGGGIRAGMRRRSSDAEIDAYIRATSITVHHPLGTCRMGSAHRTRTAVVDPELKVRGIDNLRVVDASVMPDMLTGNINAAVMMIAEKAADLIRGRSSASGTPRDLWSQLRPRIFGLMVATNCPTVGPEKVELATPRRSMSAVPSVRDDRSNRESRPEGALRRPLRQATCFRSGPRRPTSRMTRSSS